MTLRIRDASSGSRLFLSRIPGSKSTRFRIHKAELTKNSEGSGLINPVGGSVADPGFCEFGHLDPESGYGIRIWIRDPDLRSGWKRNPDSDLESEMNIPNHFSQSLKIVFRVKNT
jgi:hypothetical protein